MTRRVDTPLPRTSRSSPLWAVALRTSIAEMRASGETARSLRSDLVAGCVVGVVALPLSMALAIAIGMPPKTGLFTAIVAGFVAALLGGSRVQVTGPTAAFVVILAPIVGHYGPAGLMVASCMAGALLLLLGLLRMGRLVEFIPNPVTAGFTMGIATVIALMQVKDMLGVTLPAAEGQHLPAWRESTVALVVETFRALPQTRPGDVVVGLMTLAMLLIWPRVSRRVPSAIVALPVAALLAWWLSGFGESWRAATIDSRFGQEVDGVFVGGVPRDLPSFLVPWDAEGPEHRHLEFNWSTVSTLLRYALAIALLGAIESLLSAVVADGLTGRRHDPDGELVGQGMANMVAPLFGGFAATGALARTAANVRAGGRTPIAAAAHALFLLAAILLLAPWLGMLPMAAMGALLIMVARNMSDFRHCLFVVRRGPRGDALTLVVCFALTVAFDMVIAVGVGVVLASLIFMRRMAELSAVEVGGNDADAEIAKQRGVLYYHIRGPLFFGAAQRAMNEVQVTGGERMAILDLEGVPMIDSTGLLNLESAVQRLHQAGLEVILCGVGRRPMEVLHRAGFTDGSHAAALEPATSIDRRVRFVASRSEALALAASAAVSPQGAAASSAAATRTEAPDAEDSAGGRR